MPKNRVDSLDKREPAQNEGEKFSKSTINPGETSLFKTNLKGENHEVPEDYFS